MIWEIFLTTSCFNLKFKPQTWNIQLKMQQIQYMSVVLFSEIGKIYPGKQRQNKDNDEKKTEGKKEEKESKETNFQELIDIVTKN